MVVEQIERGLSVAALGLEVGAALVVLIGAMTSVVSVVRHRDLVQARMTFGHALLYAFDFTIAADVLKLAVVPDLQAAAVIGAVVLVRVAMTLLLGWELKQDAKEQGPGNRDRPVQAP